MLLYVVIKQLQGVTHQTVIGQGNFGIGIYSVEPSIIQ